MSDVKRGGKSWPWRLLGPAVSAVSLAAVLWWALNQQTPRWPAGAASWLLLLLAMLVYAGVTLVRGGRWYLILHRAGVRASMADVQALTIVGYMGNTVLPARGGELLRLFMLGQCTGSSKVTILGTIIAERVLDLLALLMLLLLLAFATSSGVGADSHVGETAALAGITLLALALVLFCVWRMGHLERFRPLLARVRSLTLATSNLLSAQGALLIALTGVIWIAEGLIYWLVGRAVHLQLTIWQACFLVVLSSLVAIIPAAPGYAGTYDAAIQLGLRTLRVHGGQAISFGLLVRLVLFGPITVAGLILVVVRYGGLSSLRRARAELPDGMGVSPSSLSGGAGAVDDVPLLRPAAPRPSNGLELVSK